MKGMQIMDNTEKRENRYIRFHIAVCVFFMMLLSAAVLGALFYHQVLHHDDMMAMAEMQSETERNLQSPRGMILDRNGKVLAISEMSKSLYADPTMLNEPPEKVAELLAPYLRISQDEILRRLKDDTAFVWLDRQMDHDKYEAVEEVIKGEKLHGLVFRDENRRFYPNGSMAAQVIGFVGDNDRGLDGIEMILDDEIRGNKQTFRLQTDSNNIPVFESALKKFLPDKERSVSLTLDSTIQYLAEKELDGIMNRNKPEGAAIIVMNPKTGEILAMASRPTYDLNHYGKGDKESYRNRAVVNVYEPGSTFKPLMAASALDSGKWSVSDVYHDTGSIQVADRTMHNWDEKGLGNVTLREIIMYSINTGMVHIAVKAGGKLLTEYAHRFGFGSITGIELPGEQEGILFSPSTMSIVDTASMGIGQGIAVTPLQMVQAFSAIANDGHMMKPFIVKEIDNPDGSVYEKKEPVEVGQPIKPETAETISKFMGEEISSGGGQNAKIEGYTFAGKTGTAQKKTADSTGYAEGQYVGSFIGFGPVEDPQFLVLIVVDAPSGVYYGAQVAAPVFKDLMTEIVRMKGLRPTSDTGLKPLAPLVTAPPRVIPPVHQTEDGVLIPSFIGWSTREVNDWLNEAGLGFVPKGMGSAVPQDPRPGSYAPSGSDVTVTFKR